MNVAIVGATGAVGKEIQKILHSRNFPLANLKLLASRERSNVEKLTEKSFENIDIAMFSAGGEQSKKYAPIAVKAGALVIDNSTVFRMAKDVPLVIPEINKQAAYGHKGIIANPNCSTIIMNMAVYPLYKKFGVEKITVSTYQAASGAGAAAMAELEQQAKDWVHGRPLTQDIFNRQYIWNLFSHNSSIDIETGYNEEEIKMIKETKKIFNDDSLGISATCVRVPVLRTHCESINLSLAKSFEIRQIKEILERSPGLKVYDDRENNRHPEPIVASHQDNCFVGRIRRDLGQKNGIEMFVAGDQIRKGAALNAVQIAELFSLRSKC